MNSTHLTLSFFFKFYLTVLKKLGKEDSEDVRWSLARPSTCVLL